MSRLFKRLPEAKSPSSTDNQIEYSQSSPTTENQFDIYQGFWTSQVPGSTKTGMMGLFEDSRISWMLKELGGIEGFRVLEIGPLEGGHTYMLEKAGASVLAIEANRDCFLRCLIVKNFLDLHSEFVYGDANQLNIEEKFDLVLASGVLYHMVDPISFMSKLSQVSDIIFVWTHYYEPNLDLWNLDARKLIGDRIVPEKMTRHQVGSISARVVPQYYKSIKEWGGFCGGSLESSFWILKEDLLNLFTSLGYTNIKIAFDDPGHVNGPSIAILASKE